MGAETTPNCAKCAARKKSLATQYWIMGFGQPNMPLCQQHADVVAQSYPGDLLPVVEYDRRLNAGESLEAQHIAPVNKAEAKEWKRAMEEAPLFAAVGQVGQLITPEERKSAERAIKARRTKIARKLPLFAHAGALSQLAPEETVEERIAKRERNRVNGEQGRADSQTRNMAHAEIYKKILSTFIPAEQIASLEAAFESRSMGKSSEYRAGYWNNELCKALGWKSYQVYQHFIVDGLGLGDPFSPLTLAYMQAFSKEIITPAAVTVPLPFGDHL